ncbi:expressed unknown protein [Seminavis robusta]|uniref:Ribonuclease H1 N-terminal domain-containing protein n=1 Tax=Seminavis robusta TaxID=568900 RepID=A0A9N8H8N3_9STRA|nr:expressed unknown protein [Seminavis robusta]|eukprot:Sro96_g049460.1 n/a (759) ;mRNA; f:9774-12050
MEATCPDHGDSTKKKQQLAIDQTEVFYAVRKGLNVQFCIFLRWEDCKAQIEGCQDSEYSSFADWQEAIHYVKVKSGTTHTTTHTATASPDVDEDVESDAERSHDSDAKAETTCTTDTPKSRKRKRTVFLQGAVSPQNTNDIDNTEAEPSASEKSTARSKKQKTSTKMNTTEKKKQSTGTAKAKAKAKNSKQTTKKKSKKTDPPKTKTKTNTTSKKASASRHKKSDTAATTNSSTANGNNNNHKTSTKNDRNRYYEPLHKLLLEGYLQCKPKAWRRDQLGLSFREPHKQTTQTRYLQDLMELRGFLAASPNVAYLQLTPEKRKTIKAQSDHTILNPHSIRYLNHAWGVNRKYHNDLDDKLHAATSTTTPPKDTTAFTSCTIEHRQAARMRYTAKKLYIHHRVEALTNESRLYNLFRGRNNQSTTTTRETTNTNIMGVTTTTNNNSENENGTANDDNDDNKEQQLIMTPSMAGRDQKRKWQHQAAQEWDAMTEAEREPWIEKERLHDLEQPHIKVKLMAALKENPQRPTAKLVEDIDFWCGRTTIAKWRQTYQSISARGGTKRTIRAATNNKRNLVPRQRQITNNSTNATTHATLPAARPGAGVSLLRQEHGQLNVPGNHQAPQHEQDDIERQQEEEPDRVAAAATHRQAQEALLQDEVPEEETEEDQQDVTAAAAAAAGHLLVELVEGQPTTTTTTLPDVYQHDDEDEDDNEEEEEENEEDTNNLDDLESALEDNDQAPSDDDDASNVMEYVGDYENTG